MAEAVQKVRQDLYDEHDVLRPRGGVLENKNHFAQIGGINAVIPQTWTASGITMANAIPGSQVYTSAQLG